MEQLRKYEAVVIGASAGGLSALFSIVSQLDNTFDIPVLIVQHVSPDFESRLPQLLNQRCKVAVKEAEDKEKIVQQTMYIAPPNYHLMVEAEKSIALSIEGRVNYSRPSIDVLFDTASEVYGNALVGILLTGANSDGAEGLSRIKERGGLTLVQSPETAEFVTMPKAAIAVSSPDYILPLNEIGEFMNSFCNRG